MIEARWYPAEPQVRLVWRVRLGDAGVSQRGSCRPIDRSRLRGSHVQVSPLRRGAMSTHPFDDWLQEVRTKVGKHSVLVLEEVAGKRAAALPELLKIVRSHYTDPKIVAKRMASLGASETANLLAGKYPTTKKGRSGDLGEILASEVAEQKLEFEVPIRKLRYTDDREMALRGDDVIAVSRDQNKKLVLLKSESKSKGWVSAAVIVKAEKALEKDSGRPNVHSVIFVADRLREAGRDQLAEELEAAVCNSFQGVTIEHLLFVFSGNSPKADLSAHLQAHAQKTYACYGAGVHVANHGDFIDLVYGGL